MKLTFPAMHWNTLFPIQFHRKFLAFIFVVNRATLRVVNDSFLINEKKSWAMYANLTHHEGDFLFIIGKIT